MKTFRMIALALAAIVYGLTAGGYAREYFAGNMPIDTPELKKALSDESLLAAAEKTRDAATLLGLARFAGPEARAKILARVESLAPDDAPDAAALTCSFSGSGEDVPPEAIERFLKVDGGNGVPYCLRAGMFLKAGKTAEALDEFKKGLALEKFETYDKQYVRKGMIAALDLLGLTGETRLFALQRAMTDRVNPQSQRVYWSFIEASYNLGKVAGAMPAQQQIEISDLLVKLGGKLVHENGNRREGNYCAFVVLGEAYIVRKQAATDKDVQRAYEVTASFVGAGTQYQDMFAGDILEALTIAGHDPHEISPFGDAYYKELSDSDKTHLEAALAKQQAAGRTLISLMAADPDAIAGVAVVESIRKATEVMSDYPEIAEAVQNVLSTNEAAAKLFTDLSTAQRSKTNIKYLGLSLLMYSNDHEYKLPPDLKTLATEGYLQKGKTIESPITGKAYVYLTPGVSDRGPGTTVVAYDDAPLKASGDLYIALYLDGHVMLTPMKTIEEQIKNPPK